MLLTDVMTYLMKGTLTNIKGVLKGDGKTLGEVGIDEIPTFESDNLVTSGAVKSALDNPIIDSLGSFSTLAELESLLDTKLASMTAESIANIRVNATAAAPPFANGVYYSGTLYKPFSGTTIAEVVFFPTATVAFPVIGRLGSSIWLFRVFQTGFIYSIPANSSIAFSVGTYAQAIVSIIGYSTAAMGSYLICRPSGTSFLQVPLATASAITISLDDDGVMTISNSSAYAATVHILSIQGLIDKVT